MFLQAPYVAGYISTHKETIIILRHLSENRKPKRLKTTMTLLRESLAHRASRMGIAHRASHIAHRTSRIAHRASHIAHRTSRIAHRASHIAHRTSRIAHRASHIAHRTSRIAHRASHIAHRNLVLGCKVHLRLIRGTVKVKGEGVITGSLGSGSIDLY